MGEKTVDLNAGTIYLDDIPLEMTGELIMTTEEECNDTAFPLKLTNEAEITGTIDLAIGKLAMIHVLGYASNNWRKMHGYPTRRKIFRTRRKWIKWLRGYLAEQNIEYVERKLNNRRRFK